MGKKPNGSVEAPPQLPEGSYDKGTPKIRGKRQRDDGEAACSKEQKAQKAQQRKKAKRERLNAKKRMRKLHAAAAALPSPQHDGGGDGVAAKEEGVSGQQEHPCAMPKQQHQSQLQKQQPPQQQQQQQPAGGKKQKLLKGWFPGAVQVKAGAGASLSPHVKISIVLFYQYAEPGEGDHQEVHQSEVLKEVRFGTVHKEGNA